MLPFEMEEARPHRGSAQGAILNEHPDVYWDRVPPGVRAKKIKRKGSGTIKPGGTGTGLAW